jgi:hypothetical protein
VKLDLGTFLLQWAVGGLLFLWVTTRRREVGIGYGWLLRGVFGAFAIGAIAAFATRGSDAHPTANGVAVASSIAVVLATGGALAVSVVRRRAGVRGQVSDRERRRARVAAMIGDRSANGADPAVEEPAPAEEFPPMLDLIAPVCGIVGLLAAAVLAGGPYPLAAVRLLIGAAFLGCISDAMLLGHWYLVQPGLRREPLQQLVVLCAVLWPFEVVAFLWPTGMVQVFNGTIDDGYNGLLAWVWLVSAISTIALVGVTWLALRERYYSAVMAATGLLYLAILTAFGTDLIARAVLAP